MKRARMVAVAPVSEGASSHPFARAAAVEGDAARRQCESS